MLHASTADFRWTAWLAYVEMSHPPWRWRYLWGKKRYRACQRAAIVVFVMIASMSKPVRRIVLLQAGDLRQSDPRLA
jgi:hypothetical protein